MKLVALTQGEFAMVDHADYERVMQHSWRYVETGIRRKRHRYAARTIHNGDRRITQYLHQFLTGFERVDHRDSNGLNNQRWNLRQSSRSQNGQNRLQQPHSSRFKGVSFRKNTGRWQARITLNGQTESLGMFDSQIEAAQAYDCAAKLTFGRFAKTNAEMGAY